MPNAAAQHSVLSYFANDWSVTGLGIIQSGEPYSLYEFYGAVGSINFGNYPTLMNPVLPIANPSDAKGKALTGNPGDFRGPGGSYIPTIDPSEIAINYVAPGTNGVPTAAQGNEGDPTDIYETNFAPENQRNIFRQAMQKRSGYLHPEELPCDGQDLGAVRVQHLQLNQYDEPGCTAESDANPSKRRLFDVRLRGA